MTAGGDEAKRAFAAMMEMGKIDIAKIKPAVRGQPLEPLWIPVEHQEEMKKKLSSKQQEELLTTLKVRFEKHMHHHEGMEWLQVRARLEAAPPEKGWSLSQMEDTGGEPDVTGRDRKTGEVTFMDCSGQTPSGRVSLCYDDEALHSRKEHKPKNSAVGLAQAMGIEILTEEEYLALQTLGEFDKKRSSWVQTPADCVGRAERYGEGAVMGASLSGAMGRNPATPHAASGAS